MRILLPLSGETRSVPKWWHIINNTQQKHCQASVYDNQHIGDNLDIMLNYTSPEVRSARFIYLWERERENNYSYIHNTQTKLSLCCWVQSSVANEALLLVGWLADFRDWNSSFSIQLDQITVWSTSLAPLANKSPRSYKVQWRHALDTTNTTSGHEKPIVDIKSIPSRPET